MPGMVPYVVVFTGSNNGPGYLMSSFNILNKLNIAQYKYTLISVW